MDVLKSLADISRDSWNSLARPAGLYSSHEWLSMVEQETDGCCRYLATRGPGGALTAALPVYFVASEPNPYYQPVRRFGAAVSAPADVPVCLAGGRSAYHSSILVDQRLPEPEQRELATALVGALREIAADGGRQHAFSFFHALPGTQTLLRVAGLRCQPVPELTADAFLVRVGDSFDDYLSAFKSQRRRKIIREINQFEQAGLRIEQADPRDLLSLTAQLVAQVQRKYDLSASVPDLEETFAHQYEVLGERVRLFVCRSGSRIVGVTVAYQWDGWLYGRACGFDYARLAGASEYFNLAYFATLRYCYEHDLSGFHLGAGSHETKALHGARLEPLSTVVLPLSPDSSDLVTDAERDTLHSFWKREMTRFPYSFDQQKWNQLLAHGQALGNGA